MSARQILDGCVVLHLGDCVDVLRAMDTKPTASDHGPLFDEVAA